MLQKFSSKLTDVAHLAAALDLNNLSEYDVSRKKKADIMKTTSATERHLEDIVQLLRRQAGGDALGAGGHQGEQALAVGCCEAAACELAERERRDKMRQDLEVGHQRFKNILCHLISLVHAVGLSTLRDDHNLRNLVVRPSMHSLFLPD